MKSLICEMCGSGDLVKQDGLFVCQSCGMKYSVEEAKKMMIEGTVKVDTSDELAKLYTAARNSRDARDYATALKHYESVSAKDPDSWEALFYIAKLRTYNIKNGEIHSAAVRVFNCLNKVFQLIKKNEPTEKDQYLAVKEVCDSCRSTAISLTSASNAFYSTLTSTNTGLMFTGISGMLMASGSNNQHGNENLQRCFAIAQIMELCGNCVEVYFGTDDSDYAKLAAACWRDLLDFHVAFQKNHKNDLLAKDSLILYNNKIKKIDPSYEGVSAIPAGRKVVRILIPLAISAAIIIGFFAYMSTLDVDWSYLFWFLV